LVIVIENLALLTAAMVALWLMAVRIRDVSFIDAVWPLAMAFAALATFLRSDGDLLRRLLLVGVCGVWAVRLALHLFLRWRRQGADGRYVEIVKAQEKKAGWGFAKTALLLVFLPQAFFAWLTSLPVQLGQLAKAPEVGIVGYAGAVIALVGVAFESIGDAQLARFREDTANKGRVLDTGLWKYTRHPNYFGDALVWWGLWLIAAETTIGLWSIMGPVFLTFTLTRWSGIGITEKAIHRSRPAYADYV
ncbi:hypothetical protein LTR94_029757, partial [Friedmanniomyces endolithicus]